MMTLSPFDTIKETLPIADVITQYGVEIKRGNKALCPIHNEKTPSFTIYPKNNTWHCFGCGIGGSVIDFTMQTHGLNALEAAKKLDIDFGLGLFDYRPSQEEIYRLKEQQRQREANKGLDTAFKGYIDKAYSLLCDYAHLLRDWKVIHAPKTEDEPINDLFVEACHKLDYTEYLIDCLMFADIDEQIMFYETHREEMLKVANRIKLYQNSRKTDKSAW